MPILPVVGIWPLPFLESRALFLLNISIAFLVHLRKAVNCKTVRIAALPWRGTNFQECWDRGILPTFGRRSCWLLPRCCSCLPEGATWSTRYREGGGGGFGWIFQREVRFVFAKNLISRFFNSMTVLNILWECLTISYSCIPLECKICFAIDTISLCRLAWLLCENLRHAIVFTCCAIWYSSTLLDVIIFWVCRKFFFINETLGIDLGRYLVTADIRRRLSFSF